MGEAEKAVRVIDLETPSLASQAVEAFKAAMDQAIEPGLRLLLDMHRVTYVDSSGCGVLVSLARKLTQAGGELRLCCLTPPVRALFDQVRLPRVLAISPTRQAALSAFDESPRGDY